MPQFLRPILDASEKGSDLEQPIDGIVHNLGFDTFMYGISASPRPDHESKSFVFTTLPRAWVIRYDEKAYIEIDPRIKRASESAVPLVVQQGVAPKSEGAALTPREKQCLLFAARGLTSVDIAARLAIAERTVEFHFAGIRSKLAAANRQEAVAKAMSAGFILL